MKYLVYTRAEFLRGLRYRANYWATLTSSLIMTVIQWSLWTAVYRHTDSIAGVSLSGMLSYTLVGRVAAGFLAEPANLRLGPRVRQGTIVHDLVKPTDLHFQLLFQNLGSALFRLVSTGLPLLVVLSLTGALNFPSAKALGAFVFSLVMGYITVFSTSFVSGVLTFYTKSGVGIDHLYTVVELFAGTYVPLQFFPGWLRAIADRLPFKAIHYIPMAIWSGMTAPGEVASAILSQVAWTTLMVLLCRIVWTGAVKQLTVQGG
jgi:ABC-2 type transport system permease protein